MTKNDEMENINIIRCVCLIFLLSILANNTCLAIEVQFDHGTIQHNSQNLLTTSIVQYKNNQILLGTDSGLFIHDGYDLRPFDIYTESGENIDVYSITNIFVDINQVLWIGTNGDGLYRYDESKKQLNLFSTINNNIDSDYITGLIADEKEGLWVATESGLNNITKSLNSHLVPFLNNKKISITSMIKLDDNNLLLGSLSGLYIFNTVTRTFSDIELEGQEQGSSIYALHKDSENRVWIGTQTGIYYKHKSKYVSLKLGTLSSKVTSITSSKNDIWVATIFDGLYKISKTSLLIDNFIHSTKKHSISANSIAHLFSDNKGGLWISYFTNGINFLDTKNLYFGYENVSSNSIYCTVYFNPTGFVVDNSDSLWILNNKEIIEFNNSNKSCNKYTFEHVKSVFKSIIIDTDGLMWVASANKIFHYDMTSKQLIQHDLNIDELFIHFIIEYDENTLLVASENGLFKYIKNTKNLQPVKLSQTLSGDLVFHDYTVSSNKKVVFATNKGVYQYENDNFSVFNAIQNQLSTQGISNITYDSNDNLWVVSYFNELIKFNRNNNIDYSQIVNGTVNSMKHDGNHLWMGTDNGLIRLNSLTYQNHTFHQSDGLQGEYFNMHSAYLAKSGKLYFGGKNGFNAFYPNNISTNTEIPEIVFTDFIFSGENKQKLIHDINNLEEVQLDYEDSLNFGISALDYSDPSRNKYAYIMEGLDSSWTYINADQRNVEYSKLKPNKYYLKIKGSNKDGVWNDEGKSIVILVNPKPWFSWWAYTLYIVFIILMFFWIIKWKKNIDERANQKLTNQLLRIEVEKQTKEIYKQKQKVEKLLLRKNELFANISHEFRTPLTLIIGPISKLMNANLPVEESKSLTMIQRNANRLLTMIEQLLQLSKLSDDLALTFYPINTAMYIDSIVASFSILAKNKNIQLELIENDLAAVCVTKDAIEIVLGNLLSNAIKYTQEGGLIKVRSKKVDNRVYISVEDTGCGLSKIQQNSIFERFTRLDAHHNIEGTGIGLSLVKEIVKTNSGNIKVISSPGKGSTFIIDFKSIEMNFDNENTHYNGFLVKQLSDVYNDQNTFEQPLHLKAKNDKENILIIDDNNDMREHIADVLSPYFHCYLAESGQKGIALAIEKVPDIIICDVMMPEMDGFHVSRVIRSDTRTSHIPLMLLTALNDKESRIKGWREHVDAYLTKPFDAHELIIQIENILAIRNILKKNAGKLVLSGKTATNIGLPKKDQDFINQVNALISKNYKNENFNRTKMASGLAVSERQLNRKLKALIDCNPMDLLREFRLKKAAEILKDGYQVSFVADECGFTTLSYFSKCFKAQFGLSPKAYQNTCK